MGASRCARSSPASRIRFASLRSARWPRRGCGAGRNSQAPATCATRRRAEKRFSGRTSASSSPLGYSGALMASKLDHIDTPALLLEAKKLEANCRRMRSIVHGHGVGLRPHVKTAKSVEVAQVALDAPAGAITVSTLREAEYFFDHGFRDILYAVGMAPAKLRRVVNLIKRGARVSAIVDSVEAAAAVARAVASSGVRIPTLIEIDSDGHRAGVQPEEARLIAIGE